MPPPEKTVSFVIAGVQKAGTSALDAFLRRHPRIRMARVKETHFFDTESYFTGDMDIRAAYHALFPDSAPGMLLGEATPIYLYWEPAPARLHAYNPAMKLIVLLRHPAERAFSHWHMERQRRDETWDFSAAIRAEPQRLREAAPLQHRVYSYVDRGRYARQLRRLWSIFPREQTLIRRYEDLEQRPQQLLDDVCRFLAIAPLDFAAIPEKRVFAQTYTATLSPADRAWIAGELADDLTDLEALLGWNCQAWRT